MPKATHNLEHSVYISRLYNFSVRLRSANQPTSFTVRCRFHARLVYHAACARTCIRDYHLGCTQ